METFYHGTSVLFKKFDIAHALEGDGKAKFGFGVYVTEVYTSAAHYAYNKKRPENTDYYVYTLEIPDMTDDNHLFSNRPVHPSVIERTEKALGEQIPEEARTVGKFFRKYVGNRLTGKTGTVKQLTDNADLDAEKYAAKFFSEIGLEYFAWPQAQTNPDGPTNRVVLNIDKIRIVRIDKVELDPKKFQLIEGSEKEIPLDRQFLIPKVMSFYSIAPFIQEFYPEYWGIGIQTYPAAECIRIHKIGEAWGIFSNFAHTPIVIDGIAFDTSERLFQLMKFKDEEPIKVIYYKKGNPKMTAKHWEKTHRREDWGKMIIDAMKYCLTKKYEQCEEFRQELENSKGKFIVEDQTSFRKKTPDTWGVKLQGNNYVGPNLLGRLLMELRDKGKLTYTLPTDALHFLKYLNLL